MGKLVFVTGGARSGKSTYAEELARAVGGSILYIATSIPFDDEMKERVKRHKERRPESWETLEAYKDLKEKVKGCLQGKSGVLLDCLTVMIANLMLESNEDWDHISAEGINKSEEYIKQEIDLLLQTIEACPVTFIVVSNEVGLGVVPEYPSGRAFRDFVGWANQRLARKADEVYFCVSGIPMRIK